MSGEQLLTAVAPSRNTIRLAYKGKRLGSLFVHRSSELIFVQNDYLEMEI